MIARRFPRIEGALLCFTLVRNAMESAPELVALLQRYYAASAQGDTTLLDLLIARHPGTLVVGTDAAEWWRGGDQIVATWTAAWQERGGMPVEESQPEAFRAGQVGWVADRALWRLPDRRTVPFRGSGCMSNGPGSMPP
jgi:hypothetical protein